MSQCHVCGSHSFHSEFVDEVFNIDGALLLVEAIPAKVCVQCGEPTFSHETTERIRRMVHGDAQPVRSLNLPVYAFA